MLMKNLFYLLLLVTSISYSQSFSEKWNTVYQRYDYYDTYGNLIGYKKWNANYGRWDYTQLNSNTYGKNVYQVEAPIEQGGDLELAQKILIEKQRQYDISQSRLNNDIHNLPYNSSDKYSTELKPKTTADMVGGYYVPVIEEQSLVNNEWVASKTEYSNAFLFFDRDLVWFKRGNNDWLCRQTIFKYHSIDNKSYFYESTHGYVIMDDEFRFILFADQYDKNKRYMYMIGEKNPNITLKPKK
jgi:hypothetical protein